MDVEKSRTQPMSLIEEDVMMRAMLSTGRRSTKQREGLPPYPATFIATDFRALTLR